MNRFRSLTPYHTNVTFNNLEKKKPVENIVRKGENAGYQHFLLFPQCFLPIPKQISIFESHLFWAYSIHLLRHIELCSGMLFRNG